jgi:hypothetical protein
MSKRIVPLLLLTLTVSSVGYAFYKKELEPPGAKMAEAAGRLLASLSPEQREKVLFDYAAPQRTDWHFIPKANRKGVQLRDMNDEQRANAHRLLRAALSQAGYDTTTQIMRLESILHAAKKDPNAGAIRDPLRYYVTIFGDPASGKRWGLSYEGHHVSLNFVVEGDKVVASTPQFLGTNPAVVQQDREGFKKGTQVLKAEEQLGFELVNSLSPEQRKEAVIADKAPADIRAGGEAQPPQTPPAGIAYADLNPEQRELVRALVMTYARKMTASVAAKRMDAIYVAGWNKVHFAWAGALKPGIGHYYRLQGPTVLIELDNTQPGPGGKPANHVHSVWRDMRGDFAIPLQ